MAMTNAQYQARWRDKHIENLREAKRVANLLARRGGLLTAADIEELGGLLCAWLDREGARILRRTLKKLKEPTAEDEKGTSRRA